MYVHACADLHHSFIGATSLNQKMHSECLVLEATPFEALDLGELERAVDKFRGP